jgi:hypothetical protein
MKMSKDEKIHHTFTTTEDGLYSMPDFNTKKEKRNYCITMATGFALGLIPIEDLDFNF